MEEEGDLCKVADSPKGSKHLAMKDLGDLKSISSMAFEP